MTTNNRKKPSRTSAAPTSFDQARDELFSHILRCGVIEADLEQQKAWMDDTMQYIAERYSDLGEEPSVEGDVVYSPRGCWHGFNNTSNEDVVLAWGWMGAGSIEDSGYEVDPTSHRT